MNHTPYANLQLTMLLELSCNCTIACTLLAMLLLVSILLPRVVALILDLLHAAMQSYMSATPVGTHLTMARLRLWSS